MNLILFFVAMVALIGMIMFYTLSKISTFNADGGTRRFDDLQISDRAEVKDLYADSVTASNASFNNASANKIIGADALLRKAEVEGNLTAFTLDVSGLTNVGNLNSSGIVTANTIDVGTLNADIINISTIQFENLDIINALTTKTLTAETSNTGSTTASSLNVTGNTTTVGINASGNISTIGILSGSNVTSATLNTTGTATIATLNSTTSNIGTATASTVTSNIVTANTVTASGSVTSGNITANTLATDTIIAKTASEITVNSAVSFNNGLTSTTGEFNNQLIIPTSGSSGTIGEIFVGPSDNLSFYTNKWNQTVGFTDTSETYYDVPSIPAIPTTTITVALTNPRMLCSGPTFFVYTDGTNQAVTYTWTGITWVNSTITMTYSTVNAVYTAPYLFISSTDGTNCEIKRYLFQSPNFNFTDNVYSSANALSALSCGNINSGYFVMFVTYNSSDLTAGVVRVYNYTSSWGLLSTFNLNTPGLNSMTEMRTFISNTNQFGYFSGVSNGSNYTVQIYNVDTNNIVTPAQTLSLTNGSPQVGSIYQWMNVVFYMNNDGYKWMHFILPQKGGVDPSSGAVNSYLFDGTTWQYNNGFAINTSIPNDLVGYVGNSVSGGSGLAGGQGTAIFSNQEYSMFVFGGIGGSIGTLPFRSYGQNITFYDFVSSSSSGSACSGIGLAGNFTIVPEIPSGFSIYSIINNSRTQDYLTNPNPFKLTGTNFANGEPIILPQVSVADFNNPSFIPAPRSFFVDETGTLRLFVNGKLLTIDAH